MNPKFAFWTSRKFWAGLFIFVGLSVILIYGTRSYRSYVFFKYTREQGLDNGTASVSAIRDWMNVRYVSVAYSVPQEYIFDHLNIAYDRHTDHDTLGELNDRYHFGLSPKGDYPLIVDLIAQAILDYRENPVATGLDDVRPWMTIRYIANSSGVPETYLFTQLQITNEENNAVLPLSLLTEKTKYNGGLKALIENMKVVLAQYQEGQ